ncbi:MAG: carboxylesterase family protein [Chloroflexi bacterium]|nr:carboxylesterase family protein [Chloroflexota bacterium]
MSPTNVSSRSEHRRPPRFARAILVALVLCSLALLPAPASLAAPGGPLVKIETGWLRGIEINGVQEFLGVPYAAPPISDLRWRPPAAAAAWSGMRDATTLPEACSQLASVTLPRIENEDCLYLDVYVYRPKNTPRAGKLPVLFWIHNGGFTGIGAKQFDGSPLATANGAVVVVPNWRQDLFGFLALPSLTGESADASSGNYGILDQQAALRWTQRNIAVFGGDPHNVTIFGQDAGGASACIHLASPTSAGLFRRASMLNGWCDGLSSLASAEGSGTSLAESLGCTDPANVAACMRGKSTAELLDASGTWASANPNVSGTLLAAQPLDAIKAGTWNKAPVLIGSAHDGYTFIFYYGGLYYVVNADNYADWVAYFFGAAAPQVLAEYPLGNYPSALFALNAAATDAWLACPTRTLTGVFAAAAPTYAYEFAATGWQQNQMPAPDDFPFGAFDGAELPYLFPSFPHIGAFTTSQQRLSSQMIHYWGSFGAAGIPTAPLSALWPLYTPQTQGVLQLREGGSGVIRDFAADHHCTFWDGLSGYGITRSSELRMK